MSLHIRPIVIKDIPAMLSVEKEAFPDSPWDEDDFRASLIQRKNIGLLAILDSKVIGYVIYHTAKKRLNIVSLAVQPKYQRNKIGTQLVGELIDLLNSNRRTIGLTASERNLPSHLFFKAIGFTAVNVLRDFYGPNNDGYDFIYQKESTPKKVKYEKAMERK